MRQIIESAKNYRQVIRQKNEKGNLFSLFLKIDYLALYVPCMYRAKLIFLECNDAILVILKGWVIVAVLFAVNTIKDSGVWTLYKKVFQQPRPFYLNPKGTSLSTSESFARLGRHIMLMDPICTPLRCKPFFGLAYHPCHISAHSRPELGFRNIVITLIG